MNRIELQQQIEDKLRENPGTSDRALGTALGCDGKTIAKVRSCLENEGVIPQSKARTGLDGRTRGASPDPMTRPHAPALGRPKRRDRFTCPKCGKSVFWQSFDCGGRWHCKRCDPPPCPSQVLQEIDFGR